MAELVTDFRKMLDKDFKDAVEAVKKTLEVRAPVDTGNLKASIAKKVQGASGYVWNAELTTGTGEEYPSILDFGSGPHVIRARKAKVLTDGERFFGKVVNHPGSTKHKGWWSAPLVDKVFDDEMSR